jgi:hypothetical protein
MLYFLAILQAVSEIDIYISIDYLYSYNSLQRFMFQYMVQNDLF